MARLDIVRKATACAVLAAFAAFASAGCSAGHSSASKLSAGAVGSSPASGNSTGATGTAAASQGSSGGSASGGASSQATAPSSGGHPTRTGPPQATGTPSPVASNITVAPAGTMLKGPMKITAVYCGPLSAAQQAKFGTTAAGGLIYRYANTSSDSGSAKLYVGFTNGNGVVGSNYAGTVPNIGPGKSAEGEVDAVGIEGQDLNFTGCEIMSYALVSSVGVDPVSYAG